MKSPNFGFINYIIYLKKTFLKELDSPHSCSFMHITIFFFLKNINEKLDINASYKF